MTNKILFGAAVVAAAWFGTFIANQNYNQVMMSNLDLDHIEAFGQEGCEPGTYMTDPSNGELKFIVKERSEYVLGVVSTVMLSKQTSNGTISGCKMSCGGSGFECVIGEFQNRVVWSDGTTDKVN